jgi:hypothetical protein
MPLSVVRQRAGSSIKFDHRRYEFVVVMQNPNVLEIHPRAEFAIEHLSARESLECYRFLA